MATKKSPAYQWYPKDALTDDALAAMSFEAEGFYRYCLDMSWLNDGLPVDDNARFSLLRKCKTRSQFDRLWREVADRFRVGRGGKLRNRRQESERAKQKKFSKSRKESAKKRWDSERKNSDARASAHASELASNSQCFAFAFSSADQDQEPKEPRAARVAQAVKKREQAAMSIRDIRGHLQSACHRLVEGDDPQYHANDPHQFVNLNDELKSIASNKLHCPDYDAEDIRKIVDSVLATRARRLA